MAFVLARIWFIGTISLAPDEAYYWDWSRHLDWSYYDQGPMLAWVIRAGTSLLGPNEWGVRLGALVAGLGISASYIFLARRMGRPAAAPWLVLAGNAMLLFSVGGVLMMHDSLAALYWSLALVGAVLAIEDDERWWLLAGLAGGAGVLSEIHGGPFAALPGPGLPQPRRLAPASAAPVVLAGRHCGRGPGRLSHPALEQP